MTCAFCQATPVAVCPMCAPASLKPAPMRSAKTRTTRQPSRAAHLAAMAAQAATPYVPAPTRWIDCRQSYDSATRADYRLPDGTVVVIPFSGPDDSRHGPEITFTLLSGQVVSIPRVDHVVTGFAPGGTLGSRSTADRIAANEARMREISAQLVQKAKDAASALRAAPVPVVSYPVTIAPPKPRQTPPAVPLALGDWHAAARFTLGILKGRPMLVDSTCRPTDDRTQVARVGLRRGDWAGMARAVEAGWMTDAEAIELAQSWRMGVAS